MTASNLHEAVRKNEKHMDLSTRLHVFNALWFVKDLAQACGKFELASEIDSLIDEEENLETSDVIELGTFRG